MISPLWTAVSTSGEWKLLRGSLAYLLSCLIPYLPFAHFLSALPSFLFLPSFLPLPSSPLSLLLFPSFSLLTAFLPFPLHPAPTWCSLLMIDSLYSWLPSTIPVRGLENHSLKSVCEENTVGMRKCMRDHSSMRLFCRGVPVSSRRRWLLNPSNVCHRWLLKFLMFCA